MEDSVKSLFEVKVDYTHCFPLIYPSFHVIVEGCLIGQARFILGESVWTTPDDFLLFYMLCDDLQNDLLHHHSRDGGEADWLEVSQLLFAFFVDGSNISLPPVIRI